MSSTRPTRTATAQNGWVLGRVGGAPVVVAPTTVFFAVLMAASWYPLVSSVLRSQVEVLFAVAATVLGTAVSILLHELAHGAMGTVLGRRPLSYTLNLFGGLTRFQVGANEAPWRSMLVSLAGPATNAILGLGCHLILVNTYPSDAVYVIVWALRWINWALAIFNILPGLPLDGGHAVSALIAQITGSKRLGQQVAAVGGLLVVVGIAWHWVLSPLILEGQRPDTFSLIIAVMLGWMIGSVCWRTLGWGHSQRAAARLDLRGMARRVTTVPANTPITEVLAALQTGSELVLVADGVRILGTVDARDTAALGLENAAMTAGAAGPVLASQVCTVLAPQAVTTALTGQPAADAMARARAVSRWLLLRENGQIVGAVPTGAK